MMGDFPIEPRVFRPRDGSTTCCHFLFLSRSSFHWLNSTQIHNFGNRIFTEIRWIASPPIPKKSFEIEAPAIQTGADRFPSHDRWLPPVSPWPSLRWPAGPGMGKSWEHHEKGDQSYTENSYRTDRKHWYVPDVPSWQFTNQCHFYCPPPLPPHHQQQ